VVGLGNPESEYGGTRHNLGADVVSLLAERHGERLKRGKERALVAEARVDGKRVVLAFPQTYVNDSGVSVAALVRRHGIGDLERLVVVHDELDLPTGKVKVKIGGGTAGHNGLKSIRDALGSPEFARVRVGVGRPPTTDPDEVAAYVLSRFREPDGDVAALAERVADEVEALVLPN